MINRRLVVIGILILMISLAACDKKDNKDLFPEQQEQFLLKEESQAPTVKPEIVIVEDSITEPRLPATKEPVDISPGTLEEVETEEAVTTMKQNELQLFYYEEISDKIKARINGKSYGENCEVPYEELRYVQVLFWGFDEETHNGELIVNAAIAEDITQIFKELYELKYPIERMVLVDEYDADDNKSMAANNTSAFNYRPIDGTDHLSIHSYGLAIDINPQYNPYVRTQEGKTVVTPENGAQYAERSLDCEYYIKQNDPCYEAFTKRGFTWGGEWINQKDYQHFQKKLK